MTRNSVDIIDEVLLLGSDSSWVCMQKNWILKEALEVFHEILKDTGIGAIAFTASVGAIRKGEQIIARALKLGLIIFDTNSINPKLKG